jgi:hypothetical protein
MLSPELGLRFHVLMIFRVNASKRPGRSSSPAFISFHETQTNAATPRNSHPNGLSGPPGIGPAPRKPPTAKRSAIPVMINLRVMLRSLTASGRLGLPSFVGATFAQPSVRQLPTVPRYRKLPKADLLRRLAPSRTDPHAYFQQKSDLVHELRCLALGLDQVVPRAPRPKTPRPIRGVLPARITNGGVAKTDNCRHCLRRRAQQTRRHRLRLKGLDLFQWAERRE